MKIILPVKITSRSGSLLHRWAFCSKKADIQQKNYNQFFTAIFPFFNWVFMSLVTKDLLYFHVSTPKTCRSAPMHKLEQVFYCRTLFHCNMPIRVSQFVWTNRKEQGVKQKRILCSILRKFVRENMGLKWTLTLRRASSKFTPTHKTTTKQNFDLARRSVSVYFRPRVSWGNFLRIERRIRFCYTEFKYLLAF